MMAFDLPSETVAMLPAILFGVALLCAGLFLVISLSESRRARMQARIRGLARRSPDPHAKAGAAERGARPDGARDSARQSGRVNTVAPDDRFARVALLLQQAGLTRTPQFYAGVATVLGLFLTAVLLLAGAGVFGAILMGVAGSAGGIVLYVMRARRQRLEAIEREFPAALDIMVRSLRAGLPVDEGLRLVSQEAVPIVAREFHKMVNEMAIGLTLTDAVKRMADRLAIPDIRMFAVVLGLQRSSGGSAAAALETVAETLRSRRVLRQKVAIMSNEARASAAIIGSLPVLLVVILYFVSPDYIGLMFTTITGRVTLIITVAWMFLGVQVMRAMINFEV